MSRNDLYIVAASERDVGRRHRETKDGLGLFVKKIKDGLGFLVRSLLVPLMRSSEVRLVGLPKKTKTNAQPERRLIT